MYFKLMHFKLLRKNRTEKFLDTRSIRFHKLQIEQLEDVFSAIIQGVSIVGGTTVSVFILNLDSLR